MKLLGYTRRPDKSLKIETISSDCQCDLGRWIHGQGQEEFGNTDEYTKLKTAHVEFHKLAADIVKQADSGAKINEQEFLKPDSLFSQTSQKVVSTIMAMKRKSLAA